MTLVFSADGHVVEPNDLFEKGLPPSLHPHGPRTEIRDDMKLIATTGLSPTQSGPIVRNHRWRFVQK